MSILSSLFSGISGLNAHGNAISVIGNNISNVNTVGFKASRATFADTLSQALSGGGIRVGRGVQLSSVNPIFEQGSFETTSSPTDMAIDGGGYFVAKNSDGTFYTRAGQFSLDKSGKLATPDGLVAQGFLFDSAGTEAGTTSDIVLSSKTSAPKTTSKVTITALLDAGASITTFALATPTTTSNFSSTITAYDSLGKAHTVNLYFSKTSATTWGWYALVDGGEITGGTAGTNVQAANGTLTFTTAGALSAETTTASNFNFKDAAQNQAITFDFGTSTTEGGSGLTGTTQFAGTSAIITQQQDGYGVGTLSSLETNQEGIISGRYSNGQIQKLARIAIATFASPEGLSLKGKNLYQETVNSGQPSVGKPGSSGRGSIASNSLELSNVDLAAEFVNLIKIQQGFQANTKIVTTTNELLGELVNLKR